jgi:Zn-dependent protease
VDFQALLPQLIAVGIIILIGFPVHEFSHAWAAYRLGDSTARYQGRLTLDPRAHFDPLGGLILIASTLFFRFWIGWAKPTPVNPYNLRYGRRGEALVALAGPVSNVIMAAAVAIPVRAIASDRGLLFEMAASLPLALLYNVAFYFVIINSFLFIFNLLPIPPLDGWRVLLGLVEPGLAFSLRRVEQYGILLLFALILIGGPVIVALGGTMIGFLVGDAPLLPLPL